MSVESLTTEWQCRYAAHFERLLGQGSTPDEAREEAKRATTQQYRIENIAQQKRGEWDGDLGCYDAPKQEIEHVDL